MSPRRTVPRANAARRKQALDSLADEHSAQLRRLARAEEYRPHVLADDQAPQQAIERANADVDYIQALCRESSRALTDLDGFLSGSRKNMPWASIERAWETAVREVRAWIANPEPERFEQAVLELFVLRVDLAMRDARPRGVEAMYAAAPSGGNDPRFEEIRAALRSRPARRFAGRPNRAEMIVEFVTGLSRTTMASRRSRAKGT